jgi:hypothetical protein
MPTDNGPGAPLPYRGTDDGDFQDKVGSHVAAVTEGDPTDLVERRNRFTEESLELTQSLGQTREEAIALVNYVHDRAVGVAHKEIGAVVYTLAALAVEAGLDMMRSAWTELARISTPEGIAKIRRKRAGRHGRGALPSIDGGTLCS